MEGIRNAFASAAVPVKALGEGSWEVGMTVAGLPCTIASDAHAPEVGDKGMADLAVACLGSCFADVAGCKC